MSKKIKTLHLGRRHFNCKPVKYRVEDGCWICISHTISAGYPRIKHQGEFYTLHRFIYQQKVDDEIDGFVIMHSCDNKKCINPDHLQKGTNSQNMKDAFARGLVNIDDRKGENARCVKLDDQQVIEIRNLGDRDDITNKEIGQRYGIDPSQVSRIINYKAWTHI